MVVVAVAGGTGNVGRTIVQAILDAGKHQVIILGRKTNPTLEAELSVPILAIDYSDVDGVAKILEENNVHTVISAIWMMPSPTGDQPKEIELLHAADASKTTKRMITSDWGNPHTEEHLKQLPSAQAKHAAQEVAKTLTNLEVTAVNNGFFMDYWGIPGVKSNMLPVVFCIDIPHKAAAIPGDGNTPVIFTHTTDVAKYVAASLDLEEWDPVSHVIGDRVTWNEFLQLAEEATGSKFNVAYDSIEKLKNREVTELPGQVKLYAHFPKEMVQGFAITFGLWFAEGALDYYPERTLNDRIPDIQPLKVKELLKKAW